MKETKIMTRLKYIKIKKKKKKKKKQRIGNDNKSKLKGAICNFFLNLKKPNNGAMTMGSKQQPMVREGERRQS